MENYFEFKVLKAIYDALERDFENIANDYICVYNSRDIQGLNLDERSIIGMYLIGDYKDTIDMNIKPKDYYSYLYYVYPLELKDGFIKPKTKDEFYKVR